MVVYCGFYSAFLIILMCWGVAPCLPVWTAACISNFVILCVGEKEDISGQNCNDAHQLRMHIGGTREDPRAREGDGGWDKGGYILHTPNPSHDDIKNIHSTRSLNREFTTTFRFRVNMVLEQHITC